MTAKLAADSRYLAPHDGKWPVGTTVNFLAVVAEQRTGRKNNWAVWPTAASTAEYVKHCRKRVLANAVDYLDHHLGLYLPGAVTEGGFRWDLLAGAGALRGTAALQTQHISVNIDPSDRYVLSVPGSDKFRLRPDESGYDNLVLAGDWTDCGINAGCIEAAVMSGLQAANALLGHGRHHRIRGFYMP